MDGRRVLYELCAADEALLFSPFCWRIRLALAHKGLTAETRPWRFTETEALAFSGQGPRGASKVPVLVDGDRTVSDSWAIAQYLEDAYPDAPSLFGTGGAAHVRFVAAWADAVLVPGIARLIVADVAAQLAPEDAAYFRATREAQFKMPLETLCATREQDVAGFRATLTPLRLVLRLQDWLGGAAPDHADYIVAGTLMWPRTISRFAVLAEDDPIAFWFARVRGLFGGMLERAARV